MRETGIESRSSLLSQAMPAAITASGYLKLEAEECGKHCWIETEKIVEAFVQNSLYLKDVALAYKQTPEEMLRDWRNCLSLEWVIKYAQLFHDHYVGKIKQI